MSIETRLPETPIGRSALLKASWRLLPLFALGYGIAYMDRINISFASLRMNQDLHFSAGVYGLGAGLFFLSYALCEVPSNLLLIRMGARIWIARIMLTWGVLAVSMMFVSTPIQFYIVRLLLGMAEAGFFPGVVFYLTYWFPARYRARALSRFYVALPLSTVMIGVISPALLDLQGQLGLAGWKWLFLAEGAPAVLLSVVVFLVLPDGPARAKWLTDDEKDWIAGELAVDEAALGPPRNHSLRAALSDPLVWRLGLSNLFILGAGNTFLLSAPAVLQGATHWTTGAVGLVVAVAGLLGALSMLANGAHSDHDRERHMHIVIPVIVIAGAFAVMALATAPWLVVSAYVVFFICGMAVQGVFMSIPGDALSGRSAAIGMAAIVAVGQVGSFIGPPIWGWARDQTGSYHAGLMSMPIFFLLGAAIVFTLRQIARSGRIGNALARAAA